MQVSSVRLLDEYEGIKCPLRNLACSCWQAADTVDPEPALLKSMYAAALDLHHERDGLTFVYSCMQRKADSKHFGVQ